MVRMGNARLKIFFLHEARSGQIFLFFVVFSGRRLCVFWGIFLGVADQPIDFFLLLEHGELGVGESLVSNDGFLAAVAGLMIPSRFETRVRCKHSVYK